MKIYGLVIFLFVLFGCTDTGQKTENESETVESQSKSIDTIKNTNSDNEEVEDNSGKIKIEDYRNAGSDEEAKIEYVMYEKLVMNMTLSLVNKKYLRNIKWKIFLLKE